MSDIKTRLREGRTDGSHLRWTVGEIHLEAATTISSLEARIEELEGALKVFADEADLYDPPDGDDEQAAWSRDFPIGALRRARRALSKGTGH